MGSSELLIAREPGILIATLNRPDKLNALNKDLFDDLKSLVDVLETDKSVRVLIFTGSGEKAFSVGADLKERHGMNEKAVLQRFDLVRNLYLRLERLGIPVIAAINGSALGEGLELALACDLRVAAENAQFQFPEVELGMIPGTGGTKRLPRVVGMARAIEMIFLSKRIPAKLALEMGLVHSICPTSQSLASAKVWASRLLESSPMALRQAKFALRAGQDRPLEAALALETEAYRPLLSSPERLEGIKAFLEKRKPNFKGET
jgi:enoyl-CoA hydratase/carnithine racemase